MTLNPETMMLRCAIEADEEWFDEVRANAGPEELPDVIADTLSRRLGMTGKGRHELKDTVLLALAIGSTHRIDFDALADYFLTADE